MKGVDIRQIWPNLKKKEVRQKIQNRQRGKGDFIELYLLEQRQDLEQRFMI